MIAIRPRRPTELIDASLALLRGRYLRLMALAAVPLAPYVLVSLALALRYGASAEQEWWAELVLLEFSCGAVAYAALSLAIADLYHGRPLDTAGALRKTLPRTWTVITSSLVSTAITLVGLALIIAPGIYFMALFFGVPIIAVLEHRGFADTFRRSTRLADGHVLAILGSYGLAWLVVSLLAVIAEVIAGGGLLPQRPVAANLVGNLFAIIYYPVLAAVATLLYYDLRIRKEGYDLELMAARVVEVPADAGGDDSFTHQRA